MSKQYQAIRNKNQRYPKHTMRQYLYNSGEPSEGDFVGSASDLEAEFIENSFFIKRRFRDLAHRMRS